MDPFLSNTEVVNIKIDWEGRHQPRGSTPLTPWGLIRPGVRNVDLGQRREINSRKARASTGTVAAGINRGNVWLSYLSMPYKLSNRFYISVRFTLQMQ